ncbi:MAG: DNA topoisomerase IV subunit A, partial [Alphaproteobacteria bacterium]|nr:DNA topoisomerase IV subunit A [Alphaproteobacteria bacterium]
MNELSRHREIRPAALSQALSERYVAYALSTITSRSLPDVRDGLKPVHRRLLFAMRQLKLDPRSGFKKCARVVGDVIGKYHPHGDQAVYDALVRLAQDFAVRYPLVDGQGNFGSIDGDNAAAMRYTEARLTAVAEALLEGIDEDAVDFRENYDGEDEEPTVLPARFPNLLANGASGIAVGMATAIPPHNVGEICDALLHLLKFPRATIAKLVELMPGPDFPTGGVIVEPRASILEAYASGRGGFRMRAAWEVEKLGRGQYRIVVTEMPFQVSKARLVERLAELIAERKLPALADVRDESAEDVRLVLEPRSRTVAAEALMESVFRATDLETRVGLNMNVLDAERAPRVMNLREALQAFIDHRMAVLQRRTRFRRERIQRRLEALAGYLVAYLNLDEVIRIIREEDEPKPALMRAFGLSGTQAEAVLDMRLRALRRLEEAQIRDEHARLSDRLEELQRLLEDPGRQTEAIAGEIKEIRAAFAGDAAIGPRRTRFDDAPESGAVALGTLVEREAITVVCSDKGWIRALKGHLGDDAELKYKEGDRRRFVLHAHTTDTLTLFATDGRFYALACDKLPAGRGHGEPIRLHLDLANDEDVVALLVHRPDRLLLVASSDGRGFIVAERSVVAQTRSGKQALAVRRPA